MGTSHSLTKSIVLVAIIVVSVSVPIAAVAVGSAATGSPGVGQLEGVSCTSSTFCMAVGANAGATTLSEVWNGTVWSVVPSPNPSTIGNILTSVSCVSQVDCVAVGNFSDTSNSFHELAETWNGTSWSVSPTPSFAGDDAGFHSVSCAISTGVHCLAVGELQGVGSYSPAQPLVESWNGSTWSAVANPSLADNTNWLNSVSCTTSGSCMAVGISQECAVVQGTLACFSGQMLVQSWDGTNLTTVATPNENETDSLGGISCTSPTSCVAAGTSTKDGTLLLTESWNGSDWSTAYGPTVSSSTEADNISCVSFSACMAVGETSDPSPGVQEQMLATSWNGSALSVVPAPNPSSTFDEGDAISCISSAFCAAVGSFRPTSANSSAPLTEIWNGTSWSVAPVISTAVTSPTTGAAVSGTTLLDASASASAGVSSVQFVLSGGSYNKTVIGTATATQYGYLFAWNTTGVPGGTYTLQSLATDASGNVAYSPGVTVTVDNTPPTTAVVIPSTGAYLSGTSTLFDASASASFGVAIAKVQFALSGGSYNKTVIGTATPTQYGYLFFWNTTSVPGGSYTLQSLATDAAGNVAYSPGVTVTVDNTPPTTAVVIPSTGASLSGTSTLFDAAASASFGVPIAKVQFALSGGSYNKTVIGTGTATQYGYLFFWNTTGVPDGAYTLQSVATDAAGNTNSSAGISVTVRN